MVQSRKIYYSAENRAKRRENRAKRKNATKKIKTFTVEFLVIASIFFIGFLPAFLTV